MQGRVDHDTCTMHVTLSYDNVQQLFEAMQHMGHSSHNSFTLTKRQEDGVTVVVEVNKEQNKRDWEGR